ncbi:hypothetical protein YC2023_024810 [Brassica napus]
MAVGVLVDMLKTAPPSRQDSKHLHGVNVWGSERRWINFAGSSTEIDSHQIEFICVQREYNFREESVFDVTTYFKGTDSQRRRKTMFREEEQCLEKKRV